jgi:ABC-2 type transport system permease protein
MFIFVALIPWIFFSSSLTGGAVAVLAQNNMVKKIYFPREVLPISFVTTSFINMLLSFVIVFAVLIFAGIKLNPAALLCLPGVMLIEYILALAAAFIASAVTVYFRDMEHILGILSMAWMYLTPIIYPLDMVPEQHRKYFMMNPMAPVINAYRDILYYGRVPEFGTIIRALVLGCVFFVIGVIVFKMLERHFAEEL